MAKDGTRKRWALGLAILTAIAIGMYVLIRVEREKHAELTRRTRDAAPAGRASEWSAPPPSDRAPSERPLNDRPPRERASTESSTRTTSPAPSEVRGSEGRFVGDGGVVGAPAGPSRPVVVDVDTETALDIAETLDGMAAVRLADLREQLAQARAEGNGARAARIERWIAELEAERPSAQRSVQALQRQVGEAPTP